ncbi:MAG: hypothetical protein LKG21_02625 [Ruminococcus sp.]|jgi:hypothetical protein|nr:hypothetical protein [Ruminococcus sp.]
MRDNLTKNQEDILDELIDDIEKWRKNISHSGKLEKSELIQFVDWLQNDAGAGHTREEILWKHCPKSNLLTVHLLQQKLLISVTESTMKKNNWKI